MLPTFVVRTRLTQVTQAFALLLAAVSALAMAAPALSAERATLTWDTDQTDVDLHIWDASGYHAWYGDQDDIPDGELSTDIIYGFGPETFEEFTGSEGGAYTYGVCYFGSNTADGSVPRRSPRSRSSTRTVSAARSSARWHREGGVLPRLEPGDRLRARRRLVLGGPYHPTDRRRTAGYVARAAEARSRAARACAAGSAWSNCAPTSSGARAGVHRDGQRPRQRLGLPRGRGRSRWTSARRTISAADGVDLRDARSAAVADRRGQPRHRRDPVTDAASGRDQLANMSISSARPDLQALKVAGLPLSLTDLTGGALSLYLDRRDGGGVISRQRHAAVRGQQAERHALAVGVHGSSASPVRALGGTASFGAVALPGGWGFSGFSLSYREADNTWQASGGLQTPFFGLELSGGLADGQLDEVGVSVARDVPIGATGFIMTKVGGRVWALQGRRCGFSARVGQVGIGAGAQRSAPAAQRRDARRGPVRQRKPRREHHLPHGPAGNVTGTIDVDFAISPFRASGRLTAKADLGPLDVSAGGGVVIRTNAFTSAGSAEGKVRGVTIARARRRLGQGGRRHRPLLRLACLHGPRSRHVLEGLPERPVHRRRRGAVRHRVERHARAARVGALDPRPARTAVPVRRRRRRRRDAARVPAALAHRPHVHDRACEGRQPDRQGPRLGFTA